MAAKITTEFGHAVPPASHHAVTSHMPGWHIVEQYSNDPPSVAAMFYDAYPRLKQHRDVVTLAKAVVEYLGLETHTCLLFSSKTSALECVEFATRPQKGSNGAVLEPIPRESIQIAAFKAKELFFAVVYPIEHRGSAQPFWHRPGVGISSRFAEANLAFLEKLTKLHDDYGWDHRSSFDTPGHEELRQRIVGFLNREFITPEIQQRPSAEDVYLFATGMAAIYRPHRWLSAQYPGTNVLVGMAFKDTVTLLEEYCPAFKFFGLGTDAEIKSLEGFLQEEYCNGRKVQAIWAEFPTNPNLITVNLSRLRELADEYDTILVMDDTIASSANVDIIHKCDMLVTSLTKAFNGYADAIAGSVVLNPASRHYSKLKTLFNEQYTPELYSGEVEAILHNSRDYLVRSNRMNNNALALTNLVQSYVQDPQSAVAKVFYPSVNDSGKHFKEFMRRPTSEFTPGYGCLFSIEFEDMLTTIAFYDNLNIHKSVHLGAPFTLVFAYTKSVYGKQMEWATQHGLKPTQIRVSAGLEDTDILLQEFEIAIEAANKVKRAKLDDGGVVPVLEN
ncbi:PLP-dependent transferase [Myriangium duriaei CBS 260.36]|uniref:PLP-dependent transferase n=1 Tax=Myriangium duriaei CBS 260.36 TaxID=1168546 RepID=A0A9P4J2V8_9PEZI|nr:PLP-dependent transferase [Myriangium duriaei CBS 260.36]